METEIVYHVVHGVAQGVLPKVTPKEILMADKKFTNALDAMQANGWSLKEFISKLEGYDALDERGQGRVQHYTHLAFAEAPTFRDGMSELVALTPDPFNPEVYNPTPFTVGELKVFLEAATELFLRYGMGNTGIPFRDFVATT